MGDREAKKDNLTRPSAKQFQASSSAVAPRYGSQVDMWSIWNEPNQPQFLLPQYRKGKPASPVLYRALYRPAYNGSAACRRTARTSS